MERIRYKGGYKYQLDESYSVATGIKPAKPVTSPYINLSDEGILSINAGYCWDGPSGPLPDTKRNMRAALVHDALYQLMRLQMISRRRYKDIADVVFMDICIEDGTYRWLAKGYYRALKAFGKSATLPKNAKKVMIAPK